MENQETLDPVKVILAADYSDSPIFVPILSMFINSIYLKSIIYQFILC